MNTRIKNALYSLLLIAVFFGIWKWRQHARPVPVKLEGQTMATTYHVTYFDPQQRNFKASIDSLLVEVNRAINNYDSTSEISRFNASPRAFVFRSPHLRQCLVTAREVVMGSQGAFDPTVMPLVNAWGFGPKKGALPDSATVQSLLALVGFEKLQFNQDSIWKSDPRVQLDFGGIGQGYGADVIANFLKSKGIEHMLVELGGEGLAAGQNLQTQKPWEIGILDPNSTYDHQFFKAFASLENLAFTTSGNYFNFREVDGRKFSHTIDPESGYPVQHALLSASVFTKEAVLADAWATALMVMGHEKAIDLLGAHPELDALLIYSTNDGMTTFATEKIKSRLRIEP
jgi:thiamine biosynthesis lipoprotein